MSETSSDESLSEVSDAAANTANYLLPEKSKKVYEKAYQDLVDWKMSKNVTSFSEDVLLAYLGELATKFKSSSVKSIHSMLKITLSVKHDIDISKYSKLNAFLRHTEEGYTRKRSKIFSWEEIKKFLDEAPDEMYLLAKVTLIFGVVGACRRRELYNIQFKDLQVSDSAILVKINDSYTKKKRAFALTGKFYELCNKFIQLRPNPCSNPSLFLLYKPGGTCTNLSVGINSFGNMGKKIAKYLQLPNPELYTGNCFRRTSAALTGNKDGDVTSLIRYSTRISKKIDGGNVERNLEWDGTQKSGTETEGYVCHTTVESSRLEFPNASEAFIEESMQCETLEPKIEIEDYKDESIVYDRQASTPITCDIDESTENKTWASDRTYNSIQNKTREVVNINIPKNTKNVSSEPKIQLHFNNCNIDNINRKMEISNGNVPYSHINLQPGWGMQIHFNNCNIKNINHFLRK